MTITITVRNDSNEPVVHQRNSGQLADASASVAASTVWRDSHGKGFTGDMQTDTFAPHTEREWTVAWDQRSCSGVPLPSGRYDLYGHWAGSPRAWPANAAADGSLRPMPVTITIT